jgi:hypothetical protein
LCLGKERSAESEEQPDGSSEHGCRVSQKYHQEKIS